jgi:hypothetical protein
MLATSEYIFYSSVHKPMDMVSSKTSLIYDLFIQNTIQFKTWDVPQI